MAGFEMKHHATLQGNTYPCCIAHFASSYIIKPPPKRLYTIGCDAIGIMAFFLQIKANICKLRLLLKRSCPPLADLCMHAAVAAQTTASQMFFSRDVTDFESDFESDGFRHCFTNPNPTDFQTRFLTDLDKIYVLDFRRINCCPLSLTV